MKKIKALLITLFIVVIIVVCAFAYETVNPGFFIAAKDTVVSLMPWHKDRDTASYSTGATLPYGTVGVTQAQFNQIEKGMTYAEVKEICGGDGVVLMEVGEKGSKGHVIEYGWDGVDVSLGANMTVSFRNGEMKDKDQVGLN